MYSESVSCRQTGRTIIKGKKTKKTTYNLQNTTQKTKDRATRTVQKRENNNNNKNIITTGDTLIQ
jgi:hypothetical protein